MPTLRGAIAWLGDVRRLHQRRRRTSCQSNPYSRLSTTRGRLPKCLDRGDLRPGEDGLLGALVLVQGLDRGRVDEDLTPPSTSGGLLANHFRVRP